MEAHGITYYTELLTYTDTYISKGEVLSDEHYFVISFTIQTHRLALIN